MAVSGPDLARETDLAPGTDLALVARLARAAGALAMRHFHGPADWWDKSPDNPVSRADLEVDAYLRERLATARPGDGWLSEETADTPARLERRRVWIVDPIDGTRDFVRGRNGWAVSLALVEDGVPQVAALAAPARGQLFVAARGRGCQLNGRRLRLAAAGEGIRLPIDAQNLDAAFWPAPWPGGALVEKPNSLALRMAKIAAGEADAWLEGRTVNEWDVAASVLILAEAGGVVTDRQGRALLFNKPEPVVRGIAAGGPAVQPLVLDYLQHALRVFAERRRATAA
jgi:myo-inositol-1(or 4)-monophosphatase